MPATAIQRPPQISRKPPFNISNGDSKEIIKESGIKCNTSSPSSLTNAKSKSLLEVEGGGGTGGGGETLSKKPVMKKTTKTEDEKTGKKTSAAVNDKIPKKSAQRTKGSTSLNKTIDKTSSESVEKAKAASGDKMTATKEPKEESVEKPKNKTDKSSVDTLEKKPKTASKKPTSKGLKAHTPKAPDWPKTPVDQVNCEPVEPTEKTSEVATADEPQVTTNSNQAMSSSFFERLQLGVKAYFSSRNSFICSEKNKKEGGRQIRGRVGNGVKEEAQKTDPGFELKNEIYISESDSLFDQLRVNSSLGREPSNLLTDKPKALQNLKRKNSYLPKNHCVRKQIPRKGYFCRSSVQPETPGSPTSSPLQPLEPSHKPKNNSKVQVPGVAPTDFEVARLPVKKKLTKTRKRSEGARVGLVHSDAESFESVLLSGSSDRPTCPRRLPDCDPEETANDNLGLSSAGKAERRRSGKSVSFFGDLFPEFVNPEREGERQRISIWENSFSADGQKKKKKTAAGVGGDCFEVLDSASVTGPLSPRKKPAIKSSPHPGSTFQTLADCISSVLGEEEFIHNLEITPVNSKKNDVYLNLQEEPVRDSSLKSPSANGSGVELDALFMTPLPSAGFEGSDDRTWNNPITELMGDIDLHLEFQNYLKAFDNFTASKTRTKNTLHSNTAKRGGDGHPELRTRTEDLFEGEENDLSSTLGPVRVDDEAPNGSFNEEVEEERVESRLARSQTQLASMLDLMRRNKPESDEGLKRIIHLGEEPIDGYEKIYPFDSHSGGGSSRHNFWKDASAEDEESLQEGSSTSGNAASQEEKPFGWALTLQDLIEIYKSVLKENEKLKRSSRKSAGDCLTAHLFFLLTEKLIQKQNKADLINFSKAFYPNRELLGGGKRPKKRNEFVYVKEYVSAFQQILRSSMTIPEIAHLNSVMSALESCSEQSIQQIKAAIALEKEKARTKRKKAKTSHGQPPSRESPEANATPASKSSTSLSKPSLKKQEKASPGERKREVRLLSPKDIQLMLESLFNSEGEGFSGLSNLKGKILVDVQLSGNQILVNDLSFLNNEKSLPEQRFDTPNGTSELIIESVTKAEMRDACSDKTKSNEPRAVKQPRKVNKQGKGRKGKGTAAKPPKPPKRVKPKETPKKKIRKCARKPLKPPPKRFEYDEMVLRAQHPIDPIAEGSEATIVEQHLEGNSEKDAPPVPEAKILNDPPPIDPEFLRKVLTNRFFLEDLLCKFKWNETAGKALGRTKSHVMEAPPTAQQSAPPAVSTKPPQTIRSLVDLKTEPASWKKIHKTPSLWPRNTFFCYSYVQSPPQDKPLKRCQTPMRGGSCEVLGSETGKVRKLEAEKISQDFELKRQKSGLNISKLQNPPTRGAESAGKKSTDSLLYFNDCGDLSDCCSFELLFSENSAFEGKPNPRTDSEEPLIKKSASENLTNGSNVSIVLHPFNNALDDRSFSLDLIHSDSFLKNFSQGSLLEKNPWRFFTGTSDIKFHNERVTESDREVKSFITFVLSPEQFEKADLPAEKVLIIKKTRAPKVTHVEEATDAEEFNPEAELKSIENFIKAMSESRAAEKKTKSKVKTEEKKVYSPLFASRKSKTRCQTCQFLSWQESQKQKKILEKMEGGEKTRFRLTAKSDKSQLKNVRNLARTENPKSFSQKDVSQRKTVRNVPGSKIKHVTKTKEENRAQGLGLKEGEKREEANSYSKMSMNLEDVPLDLLEALKNAIDRVESFKKKKKIISTIEEDLEKRKHSDGEKPRDLNVVHSAKSFIIKIHCDRGSKKTERPRSEEVHLAKPQETKPKAELLDSLLNRKVKAEDLEEKDSAYFDAVERDLRGDLELSKEQKNGSVKMPKRGSPRLKVKGNAKPILKVRGEVLPLTRSAGRVFSKHHLEEKSEELVLSEISNSLVEGQISYSLLLLDCFLEKAENLISKKEKSTKLKELIKLVEEKTQNLMTSLERSAWLKVMVVLDELSQLLVDEGVEQTMKAHLQSTKTFVQKILEQNTSRMDDLQKFNSSISQPSSEGKDDDQDGNAFGIITRCLKHLRHKFADKETPEQNNELVTLVKTKQLFEEKSPDGPKAPQKEKPTTLTSKTCSNQSVLSEIRDMKNKVVEELRSLENMFIVSDWTRSSSSWEEATSLPKNWRMSGASAGGGASKEGRLSRSSGYMHLMQCLMKLELKYKTNPFLGLADVEKPNAEIIKPKEKYAYV